MGRMKRNITLLCVLVLGLSACAAPRHYSQIPPRWDIRNSPIPVPQPEAKPRPPNRAVVRRAVQSPVQQNRNVGTGAIVVARGDTVYGLSRKHGVEVRDLISANNLRPPYLLRPGDRLSLPGSRFHVVRRGETGYSISRRYGVDVTTLMRMNNIRPPYRLAVDQRLRIPQSTTQVAAVEPAPTKRPIVRTPPPKSTPANTEVKASSKVSQSGFQWPVEGRVISSFGPKENGLHNDGINIATKRGAHVRAARDGVVAYAGNGFKGFGNILLVRHSGGWITAYAHNERLLVSKGQAVKRGQVIARAGSSGSVSTSQLHFEIRRGKEPVNPRAQLPKI